MKKQDIIRAFALDLRRALSKTLEKNRFGTLEVTYELSKKWSFRKKNKRVAV
jgi:hypothetical protein